MPSSFRTPKTLSEWIELDYFERRGRFRSWRRPIGWATLILLAGAITGYSMWPSHQKIYQSGPVSSAHTMFNQNCEICHSEAFQTVTRLWRGDSVRTVPNEACAQCHAGPPHHVYALGDPRLDLEARVKDPDCATCHQEHRGHPLLAQVDDSHCIQCHADLEKTLKESKFCRRVTDFANHPGFGLHKGEQGYTDPGAILFNHQTHLDPNGLQDPVTNTLRKLACQECHQLDGSGRYMRPINYQMHCQKCHPLSISVFKGPIDSRLEKAAAAFAMSPAPHVSPSDARAALRERYTEFTRQNPAIRGTESSPQPARQFPGKRYLPKGDMAEWAWVHDQTDRAEKLLFENAGGCRKCHLQPPDSELRTDPRGLPVFLPTRIPSRWFPHSIFSHEAHREIDCKQCHQTKDGKLVSDSMSTSDVLMPAIDSCQKCHNSQVGARTNCVECHQFHHASESPEKTWTIPELLTLGSGYRGASIKSR